MSPNNHLKCFTCPGECYLAFLESQPRIVRAHKDKSLEDPALLPSMTDTQEGVDEPESPTIQHATNRFFRFPFEIRVCVYELLILPADSRYPTHVLEDDFPNYQISGNILRTCRTCLNEGRHVLYGSGDVRSISRLHFSNPSWFAKDFLHNIGNVNRHLIRFISHEKLVNITGKDMKLSSVWSVMLDRLPNLEHLKIIIRPAIPNPLACSQEQISLLHRCRARLDKYGALWTKGLNPSSRPKYKSLEQHRTLRHHSVFESTSITNDADLNLLLTPYHPQRPLLGVFPPKLMLLVTKMPLHEVPPEVRQLYSPEPKVKASFRTVRYLWRMTCMTPKRESADPREDLDYVLGITNVQVDHTHANEDEA